MRPVAGRIAPTALLIAWLTAVLVGFYAVQKPFALGQAQAMAQAMAQAGWNIVVAVIMLGAATRLGLWINRCFSLPALSIGERFGLKPVPEGSDEPA